MARAQFARIYPAASAAPVRRASRATLKLSASVSTKISTTTTCCPYHWSTIPSTVTLHSPCSLVIVVIFVIVIIDNNRFDGPQTSSLLLLSILRSPVAPAGGNAEPSLEVPKIQEAENCLSVFRLFPSIELRKTFSMKQPLQPQPRCSYGSAALLSRKKNKGS